LKCGEPLTDEIVYHSECLNQLIYEGFEEIKLLEARKAKLEKELGVWPFQK